MVSATRLFYPLFLVFALSAQDISCREANVRIRQGRLVGSTVTSVSSRTEYFAFKGIPYAQPPVKSLRFQPPKPHPGWEGTLDATKHGPICPQVDEMIEETASGEEDCLYLNVYTPFLKKELEGDPLPVMLWIHGGLFRHGSGNTTFYNPDYFMDENVVMVTINYRLGVLGFLNLEDDSISGNMGLKDMILALNWIQKNIEHFGGDPKKVTIFGNSAGGAAVDLLVLSPETKGLFSRAICQSGVALAGIYLDWGPKDRAFTLAKRFGETSTSSKHILSTLMKADAMDLALDLSRTLDADETVLKQIGVMPFSPSIDRNGKQPVVPKYPEEIYSEGKLPNPDVSIMLGFTSQESLYHAQYWVKRVDFLRQITKRFIYLFPLRGLYAKYRSNYFYEVAYRLKHFYFTNGTLEVHTENSMDEFLTFSSDLVVYPVDKAVRAYAKLSKAPVYYYRFSYEGGLNYFKSKAVKSLFKEEPDIEVDGASEMDEICYLFKCEKMSSKYKKLHKGDEESSDLKTIKRMVRLWTNFAKTGNPTPENDDVLEDIEWKPVTKDRKNFLDINTKLSTGVNPHFKSIEFWDAMYEHYTPLATGGVLVDPPKDEL